MEKNYALNVHLSMCAHISLLLLSFFIFFFSCRLAMCSHIFLYFLYIFFYFFLGSKRGIQAGGSGTVRSSRERLIGRLGRQEPVSKVADGSIGAEFARACIAREAERGPSVRSDIE